MDVFDKITALADLSNDVCGLNHGPETDTDDYKAVDVLTQPVGDISKEMDEDPTHIYIPLCQSCIDGLHDDNWLLIYCLDCHSSQWIYKPEARLQYGEHNLIWIKGCHNCSEKPREIYYK